MARLERAEPIYAAAQQWLNESIIGNRSLFEPSLRIWSMEIIFAFRTAFTETPIGTEQTFEEKFQLQMRNQPPEIKKLAAEMLWVLLLFARSTVGPARKLGQITTVWGWSDDTLDVSHPLLQPPLLAGIGNVGMAFNGQRAIELDGLIDAVLALKKVGPELMSLEPDSVAELLDGVPTVARRNIRNILLHLLYPHRFEQITSNSHKQRVVKAFADLLPEGQTPRMKPAIAVDQQLRIIRARLEEQFPGRAVDFYGSPWLERWAEAETLPVDPAGDTQSGNQPTQRKASSAPSSAHSSGGSEAESRSIGVGQTQTPAADAVPQLDAEAANDETRAGVWLAQQAAERLEIPRPAAPLLFMSLIGIMRDELQSHSATKVNHALVDALRANGVGLITATRALLGDENIDLHAAPDPLPEVRLTWSPLFPIIAAGHEIRAAVAVAEAQPLSPRHLLAVLLMPGEHSVVPTLAAMGVDAAPLRRALLDSVLLRGMHENRDAWRELLQTISTPRPSTPDIAYYAGFSTDSIPSDDGAAITPEHDKLDVMKDVTALCEVLAAEKTDPPLAVGLFGDWGTGKSFFMQLMRQKIISLGEENGSFYCERVVQVWFNAWHYMDTNLWASLAARVFEELAEHLEKWQPKENASAALFDQLQDSKGVLAEAVNEKAAAQLRISDIQKQREAKRDSIAATAVTAFNAAAAALAADPEVQAQLAEARKELKLDAAKAVVSHAGEQARELRTLGGRSKAIGRALLGQPVFLMLGIAIFVGVTLGGRWLLDNRFGWDQASALITALTSALALATAAIAPVLAKVRRAIGWIEDVATRLHQQRDSEQRQEELAIQRDLMRLDEREREAQARVDALTREIDELRAGRRLQRFILERHTSAEYRQHLGLVNLIRNDFEKLSELLSQARAEREKAAAEGAASSLSSPANTVVPAQDANAPAADGAKTPPAPLPRIDRIVLYIDDLDRCPEDRVVEVLQAVHLLLAFPLFVVVVGVDSRWLLLSLEDHYATLRGRSGEKSDDDAKSRDSEWNTTPQNYLEKIFQIPFTLRPMQSDGFGNLVDALLPAAERAAATETEQGQAAGGVDSSAKQRKTERTQDDVTATSGGTDQSEPNLRDDVDEGDEPVIEEAIEPSSNDSASNETTEVPPPSPRPNPQGLTVETHEREFVAMLHPLIASPRALKRFTNIYRFLRVQQRGAALDTFRGTKDDPGQFQVAALLLAIVVGYPVEAPKLLRAVLAERGKDWWTLVGELEDAAPAPHAEDGRHGRPSLRQALLEMKPDLTIAHPHSVYVRWAREVARFSFQSGRILSLRGERPQTTAKNGA